MNSKQMGRRGGLARARNMNKKERSEASRLAVNARWGKKKKRRRKKIKRRKDEYSNNAGLGTAQQTNGVLEDAEKEWEPPPSYVKQMGKRLTESFGEQTSPCPKCGGTMIFMETVKAWACIDC